MQAQLLTYSRSLRWAGLLACGAMFAGCPSNSDGGPLHNGQGGAMSEADSGASGGAMSEADGGASVDDADAGDAADGGQLADSGKGVPLPTTAACGSRGLRPCSADEFCDYSEKAACGETDAPGVCRRVPDVCTQQSDPVCGCDGRAYGNACEAMTRGVSVRKRGSCGVQTTDCGGLRGLQCAKDQYCDFAKDAICGRADATGTCKTKPQVCTDIYLPVCGCDGTTYPSDCTAHGAGISVESDGECKSAGGAADGGVCGGFAGVGCPAGDFCDLAAGDGCKIADGQGRCRKQTQACPRDYRPVCGCDGMTYGNACEAASHAISVSHEGSC